MFAIVPQIRKLSSSCVPASIKIAALACAFSVISSPAVATSTTLSSIENALQAGQRQSIRELYKPVEYMIPMRDGTKLYTIVWIPLAKPGKHPILMERTPYGAGSPTTGPRRAYKELVDAGYILAFQDVRGKGKSDGKYENVRPQLKPGQKGIDESTDTYDTVDFLVNNIYETNGNVGLWGISYPGFYAGVGAINNHPNLKAVSPQAPVTDWFLGDDVHHNGAFFIQESFDFMANFDIPRGGQRPVIDRGGKSAYDFYLETGAVRNFDEKHYKGLVEFWKEIMENGTYNDFWKDRSLSRNFKNVNCAVLTVGGWFDKEDMWGALNLYKYGERQNRGIDNFLVMGPWSHGQWSSGTAGSLNEVPFGHLTGRYYQAKLEFPFFERYLNNKTEVAKPVEAAIYETGTNAWHEFAYWPPKGTKGVNLFLDAATGKVDFSKPSKAASAKYVSDPAAPTPYLEDWKTNRRAPGDWLIRDQKWGIDRKDSAVFTGEALTEDRQFVGELEVDLWVKTTGTDADFVVKLIDVFPSDDTTKSSTGTRTMADYHFMVRSDIFRGKFRNSFEKPEPFKPGQPTRVKFKLNDIMHTFKKGHRILVQVQSSWFPIADRNPNVFTDIYSAPDSAYKAADIEILTGGSSASKLVLNAFPKIKPGLIPTNL